MDVNTILQIATLASVIIAVIGVGISIRAYRRQVSAQFILEYTKRVEELTHALPPSVWAPNVFPDVELPPSGDGIRLGVLRCYALISQLHYFSRKGYLPKEVWRRQRHLCAQMVASALFVREWEAVRPVFAGDRAFVKYVEGVQRAVRADGAEAVEGVVGLAPRPAAGHIRREA